MIFPTSTSKLPLTRRRVLQTGAALALGGLATARTAAAQTPVATDGLLIAASMPILADIVQNVAGTRSTVFSVMPDNADPHTWEASAQDIVAAIEADTFISIGKHLEPFVEAGGWRRALADASIEEFAVADHVEVIVIDKVIDHGDHVHDLREGDPHIWLDPLKVIEAIPAIRDHLAARDPDGATIYAEAADAYLGELEVLHEELARDLATIPEERRVLNVFHDAFTYFAERYDFRVASIVIKHPEAGDVSAKEIAEIQQTIEETDVRVIFAEPQFNTDILTIFVEEQGVVIGELLTDAFADRVDTYLDLMRFDRDSLVTYLGA